MSLVYVNENGAIIGKEANHCVITSHDGMKRCIPWETVEGITILGKSQLTTQCQEECLKSGISVSYFSKGGVYFGRLQSMGHVKAERQRMQDRLYDTPFSLKLAQNIMKAKLRNQEVVLNRYAKSRKVNVQGCLNTLTVCQNKIDACENINEVIGYEGQGAKYYFEGLSKCVEADFRFDGRSRRPPKDAFNSMLSLGYSILMNELYSKIELKGLNPYFGFVHRDAEKHPTLASDMMEEWRAVIVDSTVMSLVNGHEIHIEDFTYDLDNPGCYLTKNGLKIMLEKLEKKFQTETKYLSYLGYPVSFRYAIMMQMNQLVKAIEEQDADIYQPVRIR